MPNNSIRYYHAEITRDLFDVVVFCSWGTKGTKRGGVKTYPFETVDEAHVMMEAIIKRRAHRGYTLEKAKSKSSPSDDSDSDGGWFGGDDGFDGGGDW